MVLYCLKVLSGRSPVDSLTPAAAAAAAAAGGGTDDGSDDVGPGGGVVVELEMDQLNQHECMSSLVSLLRHMHVNAITPALLQVRLYYR